jgi:hypothetical protein
MLSNDAWMYSTGWQTGRVLDAVFFGFQKSGAGTFRVPFRSYCFLHCAGRIEGTWEWSRYHYR